jgi:hypothetical protein
MKTDKNWADSLREQCFPEEITPSEVSWAGITDALHRRAVRRWSLAAALALLIPAGGVLLNQRASTVPAPVALVEHRTLEPERELLAALPPAGRVRPVRSRRAAWQATENEPETLPEKKQETTDYQHKTEIPKATEPEWQEPVAPSPTSVAEISAWEEDPFLALEEPAPRKKRRVSIGINSGLSAAGGRQSYALEDYVSFVNSMPTKGWENNISYTTTDISYRHSLPVTAGLLVQVELSSRLSLESGLSYTYLHSVENKSGILSQQKLHMVGLPLRVNVRLFSAGPLDLYAAAGGMVEKCVAASLGSLRCEEPVLQWSAGAQLGAQYRLGPHAALYLEPSVNWYFTQTWLITYRSQNPFGFSLQAGLRFKL